MIHARRIILSALLLCAACSAHDDEFTYSFIPPEGVAGVVVVGSVAGSDDADDAVDNTIADSIVRYEANGEWILLSGQGFFDASERGASLIDVKTGAGTYGLEQFSEALFRPDIIDRITRRSGELSDAATAQDAATASDDTVTAQGTAPGIAAPSIADILLEEAVPAIEVSYEVSEETSYDESGASIADTTIANAAIAARLLVTILPVPDGAAGPGKLVLFSRTGPGTRDLPVAVYPMDALPREILDDGRVVYELEVPSRVWGGEGIAVSVFSARHGLESERVLVRRPAAVSSAADGAVAADGPATTAELAAATEPASTGGPATAVEPAALLVVSPASPLPVDLLDFLADQEGGSLYSGVAVYEGGNLDLTAAPNEVVLVFLGAAKGFDSAGDFIFGAGNGDYGKWELFAELARAEARNLILFMEAPAAASDAQLRTGLARLSAWTGNRALLAGPSLAGFPPLKEISAASGSRYLDAAGLITALSRYGYTLVSGRADFRLFDCRPGYGTILMQTLASGSVIIDDYDRVGSPLWFGETKGRSVPPGDYLVSMIYRNGRRETKSATVTSGRSVWVVFNYVPDLVTWDFKDGLPAFGVAAEELSPRNYGKDDAPTLLAMGMDAHTVSLLAGNKLYDSGDYDKAIAEYTAAVNLKPDFADAYARRGNAWRKKGDSTRAIADYTLALNYKSEYPEVLNYRGYLYAETGDYTRAISDYTTAIQLRPGYGDALFNRAYAHAKSGAHDRAADDYTRVLRLEPNNAAAYLERARAWQNLGNTEQADADFARAEQLINRP